MHASSCNAGVYPKSQTHSSSSSAPIREVLLAPHGRHRPLEGSGPGLYVFWGHIAQCQAYTLPRLSKFVYSSSVISSSPLRSASLKSRSSSSSEVNWMSLLAVRYSLTLHSPALQSATSRHTRPDSMRVRGHARACASAWACLASAACLSVPFPFRSMKVKFTKPYPGRHAHSCPPSRSASGSTS